MDEFRRVLNRYAKPILEQARKDYPSQTEFGDVIGKSQQTVSTWITNATFPPKEIPLLAILQRKTLGDVLIELGRLCDKLDSREPARPTRRPAL